MGGYRGGGIMSSLASQKQISFKIPCLCSLNVPHQCRVVMNIDPESRPSNSNMSVQTVIALQNSDFCLIYDESGPNRYQKDQISH